MKYDVVVIGGSFAGLSAALQLARARRNVLLVDAGSPRNRFAQSAHGILGHDGKAPREIIAEARLQLAHYSTFKSIAGEVTTIRKSEAGFALTLADGRSVSALRVVLAIGVKDVLPEIPGLAERWGVTALHCPYCHGYEVAERKLGVLAGHAASIHQAMLLPDWGPTTYFSQGDFLPDGEQTKKLLDRGVKIELTPVVELIGKMPLLEAVRLRDGRKVPVEALFIAPKVTFQSSLVQQLGCEVDIGPLGAYLRVDDRKQTSVEGVFAAGDAASPMANATFASAAGVMAGIGAHASLI